MGKFNWLSRRSQAAYSDSGFWNKIGANVASLGKDALENLLVLYYCATDRDSPLSAQQKAIVFSALGYFILPLDLVPDYIPMIGFADDFAAIAAVIKVLYNAWGNKDAFSCMQQKARARAAELLKKK